MIQITKKIVLGLSLCIASPLFSNGINPDGITSVSRSEAINSATDRISHEVDKIWKYTEKMKTASPDKREVLESKIEVCQQKIHELNAIMAANKVSTNRYIEKYAFDVEENSLQLSKFAVTRTGTDTNFELSLKAEQTGEARVDIISPGGELLDSFTVTDFDGSLNRVFELSAEKGTIYFVHLRIGDSETTKKVRFS